MNRYRSALQISPIARKQARLYGGIGYFGAASASAFSGPPVGAGAGKGAETGAAQGAMIGSTFGPIGAGIGAAVGAVGGAIAGSINKRDPEQANFDQAVAIWQQNPNNIYNLGNKYLPLAGLFDLNLKGPHIPIYQKYGHMGEERFAHDLALQIYNAAQAGKITANDTPLTIMVNVVQPWIDSWGFGPMSDPHQDLINKLIVGMIADYTSGAAPQSWRARSGDLPASFASIPAFSLPAAQAAPQVSPTGAVTPQLGPSPVTAAPQVPQTPGAPSTVLTADGSSVTAPSNVGLRNAQGQVFQFSASPAASGDYPVYLNGSPAQGAIGVSLGLLNGGQLYMLTIHNDWYQWTGSGWNHLSSPPQQTQVSTAPTPSTTTVPIPAGYTQIGTDAQSGVPVYQGLNGLLYEWNGATMQPMSGTVLVGGQSIAVVNGSPQSAASVPTSAYQPSMLPASYQPPATVSTYGAASSGGPAYSATPPAPAVATAGVSGAGLPSWLTWGAVAAGLYLMFGTAHFKGAPKARKHGR